MLNEYKITIDVLSPDQSEDGIGGFKPKDIESFDTFTTMRGITHDVMEHWFEGTEYVTGDEPHIIGEAIAMGIMIYICRTWYGYTQRYIKNRFGYDPEYIAYDTIITIVSDWGEYSNDKYPFGTVDVHESLKEEFEYTFEGSFEAYDSDDSLEEYREPIDIAVSYGYTMALVFYGDTTADDWVNIIDFWENFQLLFKMMSIELDVDTIGRDAYDINSDRNLRWSTISGCEIEFTVTPKAVSCEIVYNENFNFKLAHTSTKDDIALIAASMLEGVTYSLEATYIKDEPLLEIIKEKEIDYFFCDDCLYVVDSFDIRSLIEYNKEFIIHNDDIFKLMEDNDDLQEFIEKYGY